jgi:hypothetical protein
MRVMEPSLRRLSAFAVRSCPKRSILLARELSELDVQGPPLAEVRHSDDSRAVLGQIAVMLGVVDQLRLAMSPDDIVQFQGLVAALAGTQSFISGRRTRLDGSLREMELLSTMSRSELKQAHRPQGASRSVHRTHSECNGVD